MVAIEVKIVVGLYKQQSSKDLTFSVLPTYVEIIIIIVGSMYQELFQQLQIWFSEHFSRQNVLCSLSLVLFLFQRCKLWRRKMSKHHVQFDF